MYEVQVKNHYGFTLLSILPCVNIDVPHSEKRKRTKTQPPPRPIAAPLFLTWSVVNSVHWWSGSTQALPASTVLLLLGAWILVGFPLTVIGGIVGKNRAGSFQAPCRTRKIARQIPTQPWYKHATVHMAIGGFLPFR